jgi:uncharacterized membrane protein YjjP (DUF1212 family)
MEKLLSCAMDIGEQMLISGAEIHRVEESISRMCYAFGATRVDIFGITSSMVATMYTADGNCYTQTRRITSAVNDFEKIHQLNDLSRQICQKHLTEQEIRTRLDQIMQQHPYPLWMEILCYAIIAGAFTLFFGGGMQEMVISLFIGAIVRLGIIASDRVVFNKIFSKFISSVILTALAFAALKLQWIPDVDKVIIGNIMSLIPGIGLTNALRDLFTGDSIAGLLRSVEAALVALAIAAGYFAVTMLGGLIL